MPSGTRALVASIADENPATHSMPSTARTRVITSLVTPAPSSARITMERVPAESMVDSTPCSAATVRPVVSVTATIIPATISRVRMDATGCDRADAVASRSRAPSRSRVTTGSPCHTTLRPRGSGSRRSPPRPSAHDLGARQRRAQWWPGLGCRSVRRRATPAAS